MSLDATSVLTGSANVNRVGVGGFQVTDIRFPAQLFLPSHYHEQACYAIVLEGAVEKSFQRKVYETPSSTIVTMPPGERHYDQFSNMGARILVIEPDSLDFDWLRPCQDVFESISHFKSEMISHLAWRISEELAQFDSASSLAINGLVLEMIALAARSKLNFGKDLFIPTWLLQARELIHAHFDKPLSLSEVANTVGVHPVHLARVFRQHFGMSVGDYVRHIRLEWATTQLIKSAELPLSAVAQQAGFSDQSHFSRYFKKQKGITPSQYRKSIHG